MLKVLINIDPKLYNKYFVLDKGVKVLCVNLQKGVYGLLSSVLLFCLKLATYLKNNGDIINLSDPSVAKKTR